MMSSIHIPKQPCKKYMTILSTLSRGPPKDHSSEVSFILAKWFKRKYRLKFPIIMDIERRQVLPTAGHVFFL